MINTMGPLPSPLRYRAFTPQERRRLSLRQASRRRLQVAAFLAAALSVAIWQGIRPTDSSAPQAMTAEAEVETPSPTPAVQATAYAADIASSSSSGPTSLPLAANLQKAVDNHPELNLGISYLDLASGAHTDVNGDQAFTAASTTKLVAATAFLTGVEQGTYSLDQRLGSSTARYQLEQMVRQSNNDSWALFNSLITPPGEQAFAKKNGLSSYRWDGNKISPNDYALLLAKLYRGELLNQEHTQLLLSFMQRTNQERIITPALPASATFYHKYGEFEDNVHDGGIVLQGGEAFVLTIFSNGKGYYNYEQRYLDIQKLVAIVEASALP